MNRKRVRWLLALWLCSSGAAVRAADRVPIHPGATRISVVANGSTAVGMFTSKAQPTSIRQWYVSALAAAGWTVAGPSRPSSSKGMWRVEATNSRGWKLSIMCMRLDEASDTRLNIRVEGAGVAAAVFGAGAEKEAEDFRKEAEQTEAAQGAKPPPTGASDLAAAFTAYNSALQQLIQALERFVAQPRASTIGAALTRAKEYTRRSAELQQRTAQATQSRRKSIAATGMLMNSALDMNLGICVWALEQAQASASRIPDAVKIVEDLLKEVRKLLVAAQDAAKQTEHAERIEKALAENRPHEPTPIPKQLLAQLGLPPYRPYTRLTVTRFWTPTSRFWGPMLEGSWKALRCWNMGCPAGCTDDTCRAFGSIQDPSPRCLRIERTPEAERAALSDPMQVYGLAALNIEVGDPDQLKQGGKVDVSVNGQHLYSVPLTGAARLWGNPNPWDFEQNAASMGVASRGVTTAIAEKMARGFEYVYGEEAAEYFKAVSRFPLAPSAESAGGELNGYVEFIHVGQHAAAPIEDALVLAPGNAEWLGLTEKLKSIARANHPALERKSTIRFVATVGGVTSQPVEVDLMGPFGKLADHAGKWSGWPGDSPEDWKFGTGLGPEPQPDSPAKVDVADDARHRLLADTERFATLCIEAVFKPWLSWAQKTLGKKFIKAISGPSQIATEQQNIAKAFQNGQGGLMISGSLARLRTWMLGSGSNAYMSSFIDKKLGDMFIELTGATVSVAVGEKHFRQAESFINQVAVHGDPTHRRLKLEAQNKITNLRGEMWGYAMDAQLHMKGAGFVEKAVRWGTWGISTWAPPTGPAMKLGNELFEDCLDGGFLATHLYYVVRIVQVYYEIKDIIEDPANWKVAPG